MKSLRSTQQYACFLCRKSFKRLVLIAPQNRFMTAQQQAAQVKAVHTINTARTYPCPDCGGETHYMGIDFKAPKKSDRRGWEAAQAFIAAGHTFYRRRDTS